MRFNRVSISNFRAIQEFSIQDLTDFILIAGPNGCGKSCVFDAIRLLKSAYGGYSTNEVMQWFGEFQISLSDKESLRQVFRNPALAVQIEAGVSLSASEIEFVGANAEHLIEPLVWKSVLGPQFDEMRYQQGAFATIYRQHGEYVRAETFRRSTELRGALEQSEHTLRLTIAPEGQQLDIAGAPLIETIFQTYEPDRLGIIDYYSATRTYVREGTSGQLNLDEQNQRAQRREQYLYNSASKYQNIKSELGAAYVRDLVSRDARRRAGIAEPEPNGDDQPDLNATLQELFQTFFPDKHYEGVRPGPTGGLSYPVTLKDGATHDINELSSGEKEVLYGYLRLRNSTPGHSVILLDEPELHLNPGLLRGFPDFYHRHIGRARENQLWLVTHSDTLLRQAVGNTNYSVFHMAAATSLESAGDNQASEVVASEELEAAVISLVGDLATYRPNAKVAIFEGGGDTDFDVNFVARLFPQFARRVNCVSGGNKARVRGLYETLATTAASAGLSQKFYAVTDRDADPANASANTQILQWDVYHIENYLLVPKYVLAAAQTLLGSRAPSSEAEVVAQLQDCARKSINGLVAERIRKEVNAEIRRAVSLGAAAGGGDPVATLVGPLTGTWERLDLIRAAMTEQRLGVRAGEVRDELEAAISGGSWLRDFPARPVLKAFVHENMNRKVDYTAFVNVVLDKMADDGYEPPGMAKVLAQIAS